jgi:hypothetical protein
MSDNDRIRIEIAFDQQVLSVLVQQQTADDLDQALAGGRQGSTYSFEADDGRYTIQLQRVVYVKRFARESRVGFGAAA